MMQSIILRFLFIIFISHFISDCDAKNLGLICFISVVWWDLFVLGPFNVLVQWELVDYSKIN